MGIGASLLATQLASGPKVGKHEKRRIAADELHDAARGVALWAVLGGVALGRLLSLFRS